MSVKRFDVCLENGGEYMSEKQCGSYVKYEDYAALLKERDALTAENAGLKSKAAELVHEASEIYSAYNATITEPDGDFMDMQTLQEMQCIETIATDAAIANIQAQGVEKFADHLLCPDLDKEIRAYAAQLRKESKHD